MKNYEEGFRYITVFGENEEKKEKLDNFLKENNYDVEESRDALNVLAKERIGTDEELSTYLKTFMTRVSPEEAALLEESVYESFCNRLSNEVDDSTRFTSDDIADLEALHNEKEGNVA